MYYLISCAGITAEFRRDISPDEKLAKRLIVQYYRSTLPLFDRPCAADRVEFYRSVENSLVKIVENGDDKKYTAHRGLEIASPEIKQLYTIMVLAFQNSHPSVRLSRGASRVQNAGIVVFANSVNWPRINPNDPEDYWGYESCHLAYDNIAMARAQIRAAGLNENTETAKKGEKK